MKAAVAELEAGLAHYLERVREGHEVLVTDHGEPVARIIPVQGTHDRESRRDRLVRDGALRPGNGSVRAPLLTPPIGTPAQGRAVLEALLEDRNEGH